MSDFLCRNCQQSMGLKPRGWDHYDSPDCDKPELDEEDAEILAYNPDINAPTAPQYAVAPDGVVDWAAIGRELDLE